MNLNGKKVRYTREASDSPDLYGTCRYHFGQNPNGYLILSVQPDWVEFVGNTGQKAHLSRYSKQDAPYLQRLRAALRQIDEKMMAVYDNQPPEYEYPALLSGLANWPDVNKTY